MKTGSTPPAVLLLVGQEKWLKAEALSHLKEVSLAPGFEEADCTRFDAQDLIPQDILEAAQTLPFGSPRRLVIIDGLVEMGEDSCAWLAGYVAHPNPKTSLVFCVQRLKTGPPIFREQQRAGLVQIFFCQPLKGNELESWLVTRAGSLGKTLEPAVAALLIKRLGSDLTALSMALELLSLHAGEAAPSIQKENVELLISPSIKETAFDILDQAAAGSSGAAVAFLRQALGAGTITVEQFMGALGWFYRAAWKAKRWPVSRLRKSLEDVLEADRALKLGHPASEFLADRLLIQLAGR